MWLNILFTHILFWNNYHLPKYFWLQELDSVGLALKLDGSTFRKRKLRVQRSTSNPQKAMPIAPKKGKKMKMQKTPTPDITISFCILDNNSAPSRYLFWGTALLINRNNNVMGRFWQRYSNVFLHIPIALYGYSSKNNICNNYISLSYFDTLIMCDSQAIDTFVQCLIDIYDMFNKLLWYIFNIFYDIWTWNTPELKQIVLCLIFGSKLQKRAKVVALVIIVLTMCYKCNFHLLQA